MSCIPDDPVSNHGRHGIVPTQEKPSDEQIEAADLAIPPPLPA
jgi:hypothetical protein